MTIHNHYPAPDMDLQMEDGLAARTANGFGTVNAVAKVIDLGADDVKEATVPGEGAYGRGDVVINVSSMDDTTGDETVEIEIELSKTIDFSANVVQRGTLKLGAGGGGIFKDKYDLGQYVMPFDNEVGGQTFRYMRLKHTVGGTTPSITFQAFIHKMARSGR